MFADADDIAQDVVLDCLLALRSRKAIIFTTDIASFDRMMALRR